MYSSMPGSLPADTPSAEVPLRTSRALREGEAQMIEMVQETLRKERWQPVDQALAEHIAALMGDGGARTNRSR